MSEELTNDAKEAMRKYFLRMVLLPGSVLSVVVFVLGYLVNDVANSKAETAASKAYAEAMRDASSRLHGLTVKATEAKKDAEASRSKIQEVLNETEKHNRNAKILIDRIEKNEQLSKSINDQAAIADLVADSLKNNQSFMSDLLSGTLDMKAGCPNGMVDAGSYCIDKELRYSKGTNWLDNNEGCIKEGFRLCSTAEVSGAARLGIIKTYEFSKGNYWVWSDDVVLNKTEGGGVFDACHVELNTDENKYVLGEWNCQTKADTNSSAIGGICCK